MMRIIKYLQAIILLYGLVMLLSLRKTGKPSSPSKINHVSLASGMQNADVVIGVAACGTSVLENLMTLLKSVILSGIYHGISSVGVIVFAEVEDLKTIEAKIRELQGVSKGLQLHHEVRPVTFPSMNYDDWKQMYRPCASQRLFLHTALPHISEILYLDVDTLVVGDLREVWRKFNDMSSEQVVGVVQEAEAPSVGWYKRFAKFPYYPPRGLNSGVMLMNLTRLRSKTYQWDKTILSYYEKYKEKIVLGEQDLLNIMFYHRPDTLYLLPCSFNYRADHCRDGLKCKAAETSPGGISILHGNRKVFHQKASFPTLYKLYQLYHTFDMSKDEFDQDIVSPFKKDVCTPRKFAKSKCYNACRLIYKNVNLQKQTPWKDTTL